MRAEYVLAIVLICILFLTVVSMGTMMVRRRGGARRTSVSRPRRVQAGRTSRTSRNPVQKIKTKYKEISHNYALMGLVIEDGAVGIAAVGLVYQLVDGRGNPVPQNDYNGYIYKLKTVDKLTETFFNERDDIMQRLAGTGQLLDINGKLYKVLNNPIKSKMVNSDSALSKWRCLYRGTFALDPGVNAYIEVLEDTPYLRYAEPSTFRVKFSHEKLFKNKTDHNIALSTIPITRQEIELSQNTPVSLLESALEAVLGKFQMSSLPIPNQCASTGMVGRIKNSLPRRFWNRWEDQPLFLQHGPR